MNGLIGKKIGMTEVYDDRGHRVAVTVLQAGPCVVVQRKTQANDGYEAVQLGFEEQKESRVGKSGMGRFKKAGCSPRRCLGEFRVAGEEALKAGDTVDSSVLDGAAYVDVSGTTKGRGFQGVVRRHGMAGGPMTHGGHSKRRIGAVGQREFPGHVAPKHRMPGHMGHVRNTTENLRVVQLRKEDNVILVQGSVPGPAGEIVQIRHSLKMAAKAK